MRSGGRLRAWMVHHVQLARLRQLFDGGGIKARCEKEDPT